MYHCLFSHIETTKHISRISQTHTHTHTCARTLKCQTTTATPKKTHLFTPPNPVQQIDFMWFWTGTCLRMDTNWPLWINRFLFSTLFQIFLRVYCFFFDTEFLERIWFLWVDEVQWNDERLEIAHQRKSSVNKEFVDSRNWAASTSLHSNSWGDLQKTNSWFRTSTSDGWTNCGQLLKNWHKIMPFHIWKCGWISGNVIFRGKFRFQWSFN